MLSSTLAADHGTTGVSSIRESTTRFEVCQGLTVVCAALFLCNTGRSARYDRCSRVSRFSKPAGGSSRRFADSARWQLTSLARDREKAVTKAAEGFEPATQIKGFGWQARSLQLQPSLDR